MARLVVEQPAWEKRIKIWDNREDETVFNYYRSTLTAPWVFQNSWQSPKKYDEGHILGTKIPYFHRLKKSGVLIPHTFYKSFSLQARTTSANWYVQNGTKEGTKYTPHVGWLATYKPTEQGLSTLCQIDESLLQRAAAKVWSKGFDASTFLAELAPTIQMFGQLATKVKNIRNLRYTKGIRHAGNSEDASQWWLEGRYGWRPLINDLVTLSEMLGNWQRKFVRVAERCRYEHETVESSVSTNVYYYGTLYVTTTDTLWKSRVGSLSADILTDPISVSLPMTAWESIPYSFVVDWLVQVGQLIAAAEFMDIAINTTSSCGYAVRLRRRVTSQMTFNSGYSGDCRFDMEYEAMYKYRQPWPIPFKPFNRVKLDLYKVLDSILLLKQLKR